MPGINYNVTIVPEFTWFYFSIILYNVICICIFFRRMLLTRKHETDKKKIILIKEVSLYKQTFKDVIKD